MKRLEDIINNFSKAKILVLGDVMLDYYIYGNATRLSPEAPIPVVRATGEKYHLGGAANVAANIASLGGKVCLGGIVGNDRYGEIFRKIASGLGVETSLYVFESIPTIVKMRVLGNGHQLARVDFEDRIYIDSEPGKKILEMLGPAISNADIVVLSDYNKGFFSSTSDFNMRLCNLVHDKPILFDPKPANTCRLGHKVDCMSPNLKEALQIAGEDSDLAELGSEKDTQGGLHKDMLGFLYNLSEKILRGGLTRNLAITCGKYGIYAARPVPNKCDSYEGRLLPAKARTVYDVTGAGDTSLAVMALAWASGADLYEACELANVTGGIVVGKVGTATVTKDELLEALKDES